MLKSKNTLNLVLFLIILLMIIFYVLQIKPNREKYHFLRTEEKKLRLEFEIKQQLVNVSAYKRQIKRLGEEYERQKKFLATSLEINELLKKLVHTGESSGLKIACFSQKPAVHHSFYEEKPVQMTLIGEYYQFVLFLSQIAKWNKLLSFNDFELRKLAIEHLDARLNKFLQMDIIIKIYHYE